MSTPDIPALVAGASWSGLDLPERERALLERVDGRNDADALAAALGCHPMEADELIARLRARGLLEARRSAPRASTAPPPPAAGGAGVAQQAGDLDPAFKAKIMELFVGLDLADHYQLLGVQRDADRKAIKASYHEKVKEFHPDRYFGRDLGPFKLRLERIFQRMTEAHDVLSRQQTRAEYDTYLATRDRNENRTSLLDQAAALAEVGRVKRRIEEEASARSSSSQPPPIGVSSRPPPVPASSRPAPGAAAPPSGAPAGPAPPAAPRAPAAPSLPPLDLDERRRALARKLGRPAPTSSPVAAVAPPVDPRTARERAEAELRRFYEDRMGAARRGQIAQFRARAAAALAKGDLSGAANALRLAHELQPDDAALAAEFDQTQRRAAVDMERSLLEQARYEERQGRAAEAARTYERAARALPTAASFERAAALTLSAEGDLRHAAELARRAVECDATLLAARVTLARVYAAAGMKASAVAEIERAASLAPSDGNVLDWLKKIRRGEH